MRDHHLMPSDETFEWPVTVTRFDGEALRFAWSSDCFLRVRTLDSEVLIEGNAAGLETLARHLLTLAQPAAPSGSHLHLDAGFGLEDDSAGLVLERDDDPPG